jgi:membrane-associated phospholipid phosphatase
VWRRLQTHGRLKLLLTAFVNLLFWGGYSLLARHAFFPLWTPPRTWLDDAIPFRPEPWAWVYLSQFVAAGVLPWLIDTKDGLRRYVVGLAWMSAVSFALFALFPVASPRVDGGEAGRGAMSLVLAYDGTLNAFPSLHAAFLVYLARLGTRLFRGAIPWWVASVAFAWGAAILYATIATRQHYAIDLVAGAAIGLGADWIAWRRAAGVRAATTMSRQSGVAFQDGCK